MIVSRRGLWFALVIFFVLAVQPLWAQDAEPLTQTVQLKSGETTLSVSYPDSWASINHDMNIFIASSDAALAELQGGAGSLKTPGAIGIVVYLPSFLDGLGVPQNAPPEQVVTAFVQKTKSTGTVTAITDLAYPASIVITPSASNPAITVLTGALALPEGTIFFGIVPGVSVSDVTVMAIMNSITLSSGSPTVAPVASESSPTVPPGTEENSATVPSVTEANSPTVPSEALESSPTALPNTPENTPTIPPTNTPENTPTIPPTSTLEIVQINTAPILFNVPQSTGNFELSISLPDGWVNQYDEQNGMLSIGNSQAALAKASQPNDQFAPGEIAISFLLPSALTRTGLLLANAPEDALARFIEQTHLQAQTENEYVFDVPSAHARVIDGTASAAVGDVYALAFDAGTIRASVQPGGAVDGTVLGILKSIHFGPPSQSNQILQWASTATGSSEFGTDDWSFAQATGRPNTSTCEDHTTAWASKDTKVRESLRVTFAQPVIPSQINIYQTFNPGAIAQVFVGNSANRNQLLPLPQSADAPGNTSCPGIFSLNVTTIDTPVDIVVIYLDQMLFGDWNEIDAVQLAGAPAS